MWATFSQSGQGVGRADKWGGKQDWGHVSELYCSSDWKSVIVLLQSVIQDLLDLFWDQDTLLVSMRIQIWHVLCKHFYLALLPVVVDLWSSTPSYTIPLGGSATLSAFPNQFQFKLWNDTNRLKPNRKCWGVMWPSLQQQLVLVNNTVASVGDSVTPQV